MCLQAQDWIRSLLYSMAFLLSWRKAKMASMHPPPFRNLIWVLLNKDRMGAQCNLIKNLHVWPHVRKSGFLLLMEFGILGFEILNTAQGNWKPTNDWNPESIDSVETRIQHCLGFSYIGQMIV